LGVNGASTTSECRVVVLWHARYAREPKFFVGATPTRPRETGNSLELRDTHTQTTHYESRKEVMWKVGPGLFLRSVVVAAPEAGGAEENGTETAEGAGDGAMMEGAAMLEERELVRHGVTHRLLAVAAHHPGQPDDALHVLDPTTLVPPQALQYQIKFKSIIYIY
jgi:hypothetical protein